MQKVLTFDPTKYIDMDQFFGFLFFTTMALCGFWCLLFLGSIVPYWLTYGLAEHFGRINKDVDPEEVREKRLYERDDIEMLHKA
ncbi:MAG: hypothetical protein Q4F57_06770 [Weeksellaceae bacterium]|nr:hypothetical protein [Weeksellaceae bacterium]